MRHNNLDESQTLVALLPGSRKQELQGIVPLMADVVKRYPQYQFAVATVSNLDKSLYEPLFALPNVTPVYGNTYDLLLFARAAIVTSGTATLETALFKVPQVVVYKANTLTYWILRIAIKVKYISRKPYRRQRSSQRMYPGRRQPRQGFRRAECHAYKRHPSQPNSCRLRPHIPHARHRLSLPEHGQAYLRIFD